MDHLAAAAVVDVGDFWSSAYESTFWARFQPVGTLKSWDSASPSPVLFCDTPYLNFENAGYCVGENLIGWDRTVFLPVVVRTFGPMAVGLIAAHEYGHAVAHQSEMVDPHTPTLVAEQIADCLAGTYMRWVAEGRSSRFQLSTGDGLNTALAALITWRDSVAAADAGEAHGSAYDRVSAFERGFTEGATSCIRMDMKEIASRRGGVTWAYAAQPDRTPITDETLRKLFARLAAVLSPSQPPTVTTHGALCGNEASSTAPAIYCPDSNSVAVDLDKLNRIAALPPDMMTPLTGSFSALSIVISRYTFAIQRQHNLRLDDGRSALRAACLTGVATGSLSRQQPGSESTNPTPPTSADLDAAVAGLLTNGLAASDVRSTPAPAGFSRIDAFHDGITGSGDRCLTRYG